MKIGIGGRLGPVRAGVSTRGFGVGVGPVSMTSGYGRRSSESTSGLAVLLGLLLVAAAVVILLPLALAAITVCGLALLGGALRRPRPASRQTTVLRRAAAALAGLILVTGSITGNVLYVPWLVAAFEHSDRGTAGHAAATRTYQVVLSARPARGRGSIREGPPSKPASIPGCAHHGVPRPDCDDSPGGPATKARPVDHRASHLWIEPVTSTKPLSQRTSAGGCIGASR